MKTTLLAIALAVATMPLTFGAQTPAPSKTDAGKTTANSTASTAKPKKHHKKTKKTVKSQKTVTTAKNSSSGVAASPVKK